MRLLFAALLFFAVISVPITIALITWPTGLFIIPTAFIVFFLWSYLVMKLPGVANELESLYRKNIGWVITGLGVVVFTFGLHGFLLKEGNSKGAWGMAFYQTIQLYFLNASESAARISRKRDNNESDSKPVATPESSQIPTAPKPAVAQTSSDGANDDKTNEGKTNDVDSVNWFILIGEVCAVILVFLVAFEAITLLFYGTFTGYRLLLTRDHIVICGYGRIGRAVACSYIDSFSKLGLWGSEDHYRKGIRRTVIVIDNSLTKDDIAWTKKNGIIVLAGDAREKQILRAANIDWADKVFIATGNDNTNLEIAAQVLEINSKKSFKDRLLSLLDHNKEHNLEHSKEQILEHSKDYSQTVYLHLLGNDMIHLARPRLSKVRNNFHVQIFNTLDRTARLLLEEIVQIPELKRVASDSTADKDLHLFWFGFGDNAQQLALRVCELIQYEDGKRPRISIFDCRISGKARPFLKRHPYFANDFHRFAMHQFDSSQRSFDQKEPNNDGITYVCDADFENYGDVNAPGFLDKIDKVAGNSIPIVVFAFEKGEENLIAAERYAAILHGYKRHMYVYAWLVDSNEFIGSHIEHPKVSFPIGFGMCKQSITYHELTDGWVEFLARWYNLAYSKPVSDEWKLLQSFFERVRREGPFTNVSQEETTALKVIEELSITKWLEFEKEPLTCHSFQHSNLSAAAHAVVKLGYVGLKIVGRQKNLITIRPKGEHRERILRLLGDEKPLIMEHNRWVAERLFLGWKYATKRSDLKKQRPQISRWGLLDSIEKQKDQAQVQILVDLCLSGLLKTEMIDLNFPLHLKKLGDRHDISHDFDLAVERYQEAWLAISSQAQFDEELAFTILNNLLSCEIKLPVDSPAILSFASRQGNHHQNITFDHSEKFERLLERISTNLVKKQSNDDSIRSLRRVVKIFKEYGKNDKPIHLPALFKLGEELEKAGNLNEAETILREAHNIAKEKCDKKQILIAKSGYHLGSLLSVTANKYQEGRSLLIESLSIAENPAVKDDLLCIKLLRRLAESYRDTGDLNRAVEAGRRAFQIAVTINSEKPLETNVEEQCRELFRQLLQANSLPTTSINKEITEAEKNARQQ